MRIAVYGDSYARKANPSCNRKTWVDYLSTEFDVANFSEVGSNLAYSYSHLIENHNRYHINIFLVTSYGRLWVHDLEEVPKGVAGLPTVEHHLKYCSNKTDRAILQAAYDYYLLLENEDQQKIMHVAMVKDIQRFPNTIVIPCFAGNSLVPGWEGPCLSDISDLDKEYYGLQGYVIDKRPCHLNDQNNIVFANKIKEYIMSNRIEQFKITLSDYHIAVGESVNRNFLTSSYS